MHPRSGDKSPTDTSPAPSGAGALAIALCREGESTATCGVIELPAEPPEWIHLMTPGQLHTRDGRSFVLDDPAGVVRASLDYSKDLVIDYEHQTDLAEENGQPAPAAGWMDNLEVRADGIWGHVKWTEKAAAMIRAREYRFLSPTFTHAKDAPHQIRMVLRAALTNHPALELTALASTQDGDPDMEFLKSLATALGLGEDATEEQVLAALNTKLDDLKASTALATAARAALKLDDGADETAIATAVEGLNSAVVAAKATGNADPAKFVPIDQVNELKTELATLTATLSQDKATAAVESAVKQGKVPPSMKGWATDYAKSDLAGFTAYCTAQPVIFKDGSDLPATPPVGNGKLSAAEKAICKATGVKEEDFIATRKNEEAA